MPIAKLCYIIKDICFILFPTEETNHVAVSNFTYADRGRNIR